MARETMHERFDDVQRRLQRVEALVETVQRTADPSVRAATQELVEAILDLHGAGLDRMLEIVNGVADDGGRDDRSLHPRRARRQPAAAPRTAPGGLRHAGAQGGRARSGRRCNRRAAPIELLSIEEGVVRLRLSRSGHGCSGSTALQQTIRAAFYEAAPDLQRLEIDEVTEPAPVAVVPLSSLRRKLDRHRSHRRREGQGHGEPGRETHAYTRRSQG